MFLWIFVCCECSFAIHPLIPPQWISSAPAAERSDETVDTDTYSLKERSVTWLVRRIRDAWVSFGPRGDTSVLRSPKAPETPHCASQPPRSSQTSHQGVAEWSPLSPERSIAERPRLIESIDVRYSSSINPLTLRIRRKSGDKPGRCTSSCFPTRTHQASLQP